MDVKGTSSSRHSANALSRTVGNSIVAMVTGLWRVHTLAGEDYGIQRIRYVLLDLQMRHNQALRL